MWRYCAPRSAQVSQGRREAAAIVGQHVGQAEGKGRSRLAQEGDGALLGFVVLDGKMDGARAAVDGDIKEALAALAIGRLQLGQMLDVDVDEAEVIVLEGALTLGWPFRNRLARRFRPSALRMRQMLWRLRCGRKWLTTKVRSSRGKLVARRTAQTMARSSSVAFQGSRCGWRNGRGSLPRRACAICGWFRC